MDDAGLTSKLEKPAPIANRLEAVSLTVGDTLDRASAMLNAGLHYWQTECLRWADEAAASGALPSKGCVRVSWRLVV